MTPRTMQPNRQIYEAGRMLTDHAAQLTSDALAHIGRILELGDGWPPTTLGDGSRSCDTTSTTERAAINATDNGDTTHRAHEQWLMRCKREDIRDAKHALVIMIRDYIQLCESVMPRDHYAVKRCDGRGFEGSHIPWIPHSRDERNGWHDPVCVDAADESGLCPKCRIRERRWRDKAGLKPRETNAHTEAAA